MRFTKAQYDRAIELLKNASLQLVSGSPEKDCSVCYERGHRAWECSFNPLVAFMGTPVGSRLRPDGVMTDDVVPVLDGTLYWQNKSMFGHFAFLSPEGVTLPLQSAAYHSVLPETPDSTPVLPWRVYYAVNVRLEGQSETLRVRVTPDNWHDFFRGVEAGLPSRGV